MINDRKRPVRFAFTKTEQTNRSRSQIRLALSTIDTFIDASSNNNVIILECDQQMLSIRIQQQLLRAVQRSHIARLQRRRHNPRHGPRRRQLDNNRRRSLRLSQVSQ